MVVTGRPHVDWIAAFGFYASLTPWDADHVETVFGARRSDALAVLVPAGRRRSYANVARAFGVSRQAVWAAARRFDWPGQVAAFDAEVHRQVFGPRVRAGDVVADGLQLGREALEAEWAVAAGGPAETS